MREAGHRAGPAYQAGAWACVAGAPAWHWRSDGSWLRSWRAATHIPPDLIEPRYAAHPDGTSLMRAEACTRSPGTAPTAAPRPRGVGPVGTIERISIADGDHAVAYVARARMQPDGASHHDAEAVVATLFAQVEMAHATSLYAALNASLLIAPLCLAVRRGLCVLQGKIVPERYSIQLVVNRDDVDILAGFPDGCSQLPVDLLAVEYRVSDVLPATAPAFHCQDRAVAVGRSCDPPALIDLGQPDTGTVIAAAQSAPVLDEIEVEAPARCIGP